MRCGPLPYCTTRRRIACGVSARADHDDADLERILAELENDEEEDEELYELSSAELLLANELELALKADMARRAADEQEFLGAGEP